MRGAGGGAWPWAALGFGREKLRYVKNDSIEHTYNYARKRNGVSRTVAKHTNLERPGRQPGAGPNLHTCHSERSGVSE